MAVSYPHGLPDARELERLGLLNPHEPGAADRLELIRYVLSLGATVEDVSATTNLGELALDLTLRPRGSLTLTDLVAETDIDSANGAAVGDGCRVLDRSGCPVDSRRSGFPPTARIGEPRPSGSEATLQLARVAGIAMARVAQTLVGVFRQRRAIPTGYGHSIHRHRQGIRRSHAHATPGFRGHPRRGAPPSDRGGRGADVVDRRGAIGRHVAAHRRFRRPRRIHLRPPRPCRCASLRTYY